MAKSVLGIAFGPGLIQVAELAYDAKFSKLLRAGEYALADGDSFDKPALLGKKFAAFLKQNKFGAKQAIAGLPTQWLMLKEKTAPAMNAENLAGMLRLQAERDFSLEPTDLVLDCVAGDATEADGQGARPLLLAAALKERIEHIATILKTAGLSARTLTSSALALASASEAGTLLSTGPFGAELLVRARGNLVAPCVLASSISEDGAWIVPAAAEGRRALAMRAADAAAPVGLWNGAHIGAGAIADLARGLDAPIRALSQFAGVDASGIPNAQRFSHAAALARLGKSPDAAALNFFDSKLVEKPRGAFARVKGWMTLAALLAVICAGWLAVSWYQDSAELAALKQQSDARKADTESAKTFVSRYASTQGWYDKRPNLLDCLKELADVIPADGGAWMTKLSVKEDFHCELSAKAVNDKRYFEVLDRIDKNEAFRDVKLMYMNKQDKKNTDVSFAISFIYWKQ